MSHIPPESTILFERTNNLLAHQKESGSFMKSFEPYDYDAISTCPFCRGYNALDEVGNACPDFCVAFVDGAWGRNLCPPVAERGNGFRFNRDGIELCLSGAPEAVEYWKEGTRRHPAITVWYHPDPVFIAELRAAFKLPVVKVDEGCPTCGTTEAVVGGEEYSSAVCGDSIALPD